MVQEKNNSFIMYGVFALAVLVLVGSVFTYTSVTSVHDRVNGGQNTQAGTVSLTVDSPDYSSSAATTGQVTLTVVDGEN